MLFENAGAYLPALQHVIRVIKPSALRERSADADGGTIRTIAGQRLDRLHRGTVEGWLEHQILCLVAGDEHFGQRQHIGSGGLRLLPRRAHAGGITVQIAHHGVELCECQAKTVGHGLPSVQSMDR